MQRHPRSKSKEHLAFVAQRPCLICGTTPVDAHHIKMANARICKPGPSIGMKADDRYTLPLCRTHHEELHAKGEKPFFGAYNADDVCFLALALYACSVNGEAEEADRLIITASYCLRALRRDDLV